MFWWPTKVDPTVMDRLGMRKARSIAQAVIPTMPWAHLPQGGSGVSSDHSPALVAVGGLRWETVHVD